MDNMNMFPLAAGFLFPDGTSVPNNGRGHENTAFQMLRNAGINTLDIDYPEGYIQEVYAAIIIRYRWGEKLIYLPSRRPSTSEGCKYFRKAVKFYEEHGFQIMNLYHISLDIDEFAIKNFIGEEYEELKMVFIPTENYTNTVIRDSLGRYVYNPVRIGD